MGNIADETMKRNNEDKREGICDRWKVYECLLGDEDDDKLSMKNGGEWGTNRNNDGNKNKS